MFLIWSVALQALCAARQLAAGRRLDPGRLAVESLLLTTNNTGILGPVVLEAALGPKYAPLGMLVTVRRGPRSHGTSRPAQRCARAVV